jgi:hypothetical protein
VHEKSLEMRHFRVSLHPGEADPVPSRTAGVARDGKNHEKMRKDKKAAPTEVVRCTIDSDQEAKMEILA